MAKTEGKPMPGYPEGYKPKEKPETGTKEKKDEPKVSSSSESGKAEGKVKVEKEDEKRKKAEAGDEKGEKKVVLSSDWPKKPSREQLKKQEQVKEQEQEQAEAEEREREEKSELRGKLDFALERLKGIARELPEGWDKKRAEHTIYSVEYALANLGEDGRYEVSVEGKPGNPHEPYKQREGVPVDELIDILKKRASHIREEARENLSELKKKRDELWEKYRKENEQIDKAIAYSKYEEANKLWEKMREEEGSDFPSAKKLEDLAGELEKSSKGYFEKHYGKSSNELTEEERNKQDLRTRHEAKLASLDYRASHHHDPNERLTEDYRAGMEIMKYRKELDLGGEKKPEPTPEPSPEPTPAPEPGPTPEKGKTVYMVDISEIAKRMAWTKAEEQLKRQFEKSNWFMRNVWKGLSENYYRLKYYQEAVKEIEQDNNLLKAIEGRLTGDAKKAAGSGDYYRILDSVIEQYEKDLAQAGDELGEKITGDTELGSKAAELFYRHQQDKWDDLGDEFKGKSGREAVELFVKKFIAPTLKDAKWVTNEKGEKVRDKEAKGLLYASNFYGLAEGYKEYIKGEIEKAEKEHGQENHEAILKHLAGVMALEFQLGLKQRDLLNNKPKGTLGRFERALDWSEQHKKFGRLIVNPFTFGVVGGVLGGAGGRWAGRALIAGGLVGTGIATSFASPLIAGAAIGGALRWYKRSKDIKYDVAQERRHETLGGKGSEILDKRGGFRYTTMSFKEAQETVNSLLAKAELMDADKKQLAEIIGRLQMEAGKKADLFVMEEAEGQQFGTAEVPKTELRVALDKLLQEKGLGKLSGLDKGFEKAFVEQVRMELAKDIDAKEKTFNEFRRREAYKAAVKGAVIGIAGGVVGQYALNKGLGALAEKMQWAGMANYFRTHGTTLEKIAHWWQQKELAQHPWENAFAGGGGAGRAAETIAGEHPVAVGERPVMSFDEFKRALGVEKIGHGDWHDEIGRRGLYNLLFEGKQQQLHLSFGKSGEVSVDTVAMLRNLKENFSNLGKPGTIFGKNWDESVDEKLSDIFPDRIKALVRNPASTDGELLLELDKFARKIHEHLAVRIIPTEAMNKAGEGIVVGHLDGSGRLHLPDNIRQAFFDQNGKQLCKYLEVGFEDEKENFHTFATSVAEGEGRFPEIPTESGLETQGGGVREAIEEGAVRPEKRDDWTGPLVLPSRKIYRRSAEAGKQEEVKQPEKTDSKPVEMPKPKLTKQQAQEMVDQVVAVAQDPERSDEEVAQAIKELRQQGLNHEVSNEISSQIESGLQNTSETAKTRIVAVREKLQQEAGVAAAAVLAGGGLRGGGGGGGGESSRAVETTSEDSRLSRATAGDRGKVTASKTKIAERGTKEPAETKEPAPAEENAFDKASRQLREATAQRVHFNEDYKRGEMPVEQQARLTGNLREVLLQLSEQNRETILNRFNRSRSGALEKGLIVAFDSNHNRSSFDESDNLVLWPGATATEIKRVLEKEAKGSSLKAVAEI